MTSVLELGKRKIILIQFPRWWQHWFGSSCTRLVTGSLYSDLKYGDLGTFCLDVQKLPHLINNTDFQWWLTVHVLQCRCAMEVRWNAPQLPRLPPGNPHCPPPRDSGRLPPCPSPRSSSPTPSFQLDLLRDLQTLHRHIPRGEATQGGGEEVNWTLWSSKPLNPLISTMIVIFAPI